MFKVIRLEDGREFITESYKFIIWDENGKGQSSVEKPVEGSSLVLAPFTVFYQWLTSPITEVVDEYNFKTKNSNYKIEKIQNLTE